MQKKKDNKEEKLKQIIKGKIGKYTLMEKGK